MVKTYHIEENRKCADPELHLLKTVGESKTDKLDLAIFAVGSNDVQRTEEDDTMDLKEKIANVKTQCELLVDTATELSAKKGLDSFIIEQIPRYESPGMTKLQKFANSYLNTLVTGSSARLHLVSQASLFRYPGEARKSIHCNDNHLTVKGLYHYNTNLINEVHNVYEEMKNINVHPPKLPSMTKPKIGKKEASKQHVQPARQNQPYRAPLFSASQQPHQAAAGAWAQGPPREQQQYQQGPPREQLQGPPRKQQQYQQGPTSSTSKVYPGSSSSTSKAYPGSSSTSKVYPGSSSSTSKVHSSSTRKNHPGSKSSTCRVDPGSSSTQARLPRQSSSRAPLWTRSTPSHPQGSSSSRLSPSLFLDSRNSWPPNGNSSISSTHKQI